MDYALLLFQPSHSSVYNVNASNSYYSTVQPNSSVLLRPPLERAHDLQWFNVAIGLSFILLDIGVSTVFRLGLGVSLFVASLRCMGQLAVVATLLKTVFETENPWIVALIAFVLNFLGTFETVVNKSPRRFQYMFPAVLVAMLGSTIPISIIGTRYAMSVQPFWTPIQYIPIVGMLCGSTISGIVVATSYILKEFTENRDKIEIYLAFGATRTEACRPIVIEALRLALTPPINNMSVLGIIAIPGMMTGAILGGADVQQAAKLQMIIMFMICASTSLASILTSFAAILVVVDAELVIRADRIAERSKRNAIVRLSRSLSFTAGKREGAGGGGGGSASASAALRVWVKAGWVWCASAVRVCAGRICGNGGDEGELRGLLAN